MQRTLGCDSGGGLEHQGIAVPLNYPDTAADQNIYVSVLAKQLWNICLCVGGCVFPEPTFELMVETQGNVKVRETMRNAPQTLSHTICKIRLK